MKKLLFIFLLFSSTFSFSQTEISVALNEVHLSKVESWVEFYNYGDEEIAIKNGYLTDNTNKSKKWRILNEILIPAKSYFVLMLDSSNLNNYKSINDFNENSICFFVNSSNEFIFVDQINFNNIGNAKFCKVPDGLGKVYATNKSTPNEKNKIREFMIFTISPNLAYGASNANYRQTQANYDTDLGLFNTRGVDFSISFWKRYRTTLGLNFSNFRYSFSSSERKEKQSGYYVEELIGSQESRWVDIKFPFVYNSFRVYDNLYFDFGFLWSLKTTEHLKYVVNRSLYSIDNQLKNKQEILIYDSKEDNDVEEGNGDLKMPLTFRLSYNHNNKYELFTSYYLRKDRNNKIEGAKRNLKSAFYVGFAYNINYLRIR